MNGFLKMKRMKIIEKVEPKKWEGKKWLYIYIKKFIIPNLGII